MIKKTKKIRCRRCLDLKIREEFVPDRSHSNKVYPWCKACFMMYRKVKRNLPPVEGIGGRQCPTCLRFLGEDAHVNRKYCSDRCKERAKKWSVYGLDPEEFRELTKTGLCPLCECTVKKWMVDHDHATGETMGPVCARCNSLLLAGVRHDIQIAERLVTFLKNPPARALNKGIKKYVGPEATSQTHRTWLWTGAPKIDNVEEVVVE